MAETNGAHDFSRRFDRVDRELVELKDDLAKAIRELTAAINNQAHVGAQQAEATNLQAQATEALAEKVMTLSTQFSSFLSIEANAIPIKAVFWMFLILILTIGGIEAIKFAPKFMGVLP